MEKEGQIRIPSGCAIAAVISREGKKMTGEKIIAPRIVLIDEKGNLTNAGALLADESPVRHSRLFCTRWNGLTKASGIVDALDDKEYTGSLVTLLQAGTDFVRNNSKKAWRKVDDGRIEMPDYPDRAVLEGIVNALIHRNYMEIGSEVHIDMFDDRIEIYSPGGMVSGISLEGKDLLKIPSKRRNPILADIFSRLKYMERRGSGFKKILADYEGQVEFDETKRCQSLRQIMMILH